MIDQGFAIRRRRQYGGAAGSVENRARFLPQIYAQRSAEKRDLAAIAEQKRQFRLSMQTQQEQFGQEQAFAGQVRKDQLKQAEKAERVGGLTLGVGGGFLGLQAHRAFGGTEGQARRVQATRGTPSTAPGGFTRNPSFGQQLWGDRGAIGVGGIGGGMFGAGLAKAAGAKKSWQTGLAGAGGGAMGTWMAGGSGWSLGLGGLIGGGIGLLF